MKKSLLITLASSAILAVAAPVATNVVTTPQVVQAATKKAKLRHNAYTYSSKGKRVGKRSLKKGTTVKVLSTRKIHGKKYARIGKNKYIKYSNLKVTSSKKSSKVATKSKTSYDTSALSASDIAYFDNPNLSNTSKFEKVLSFSGAKRKAADYYLMKQLGLFNAGKPVISAKDFEKRMNSMTNYANSMDNWIRHTTH